MQTLGVKLRLERERQKIAIEKIASDTRISQRYLEAIEADDHASLPGEFFYRAFVRQYSKYLGWNPDEVERQINLVSSLLTLETVETGAGELNLKGEPQQIAALRETLKYKPIRPPQDDGMSKGWLVFATVVVLLCGAYFAWRNFSPAPEATSTAATSTVQPPVAEVKVAPVETVVPEKKAEETPAPPTPETTAPVTREPVAGKFTLTIRAREMTWIRLTADGARVHGGTLDPGQERTVMAAFAELIVGNAGTLDVIYNGKPITYGNKGEVKTLLLSLEGWKYKPKAVTTEPTATPASTSGEGTASLTLPRAF